ncbi:hypothetical protein AB4Y45_35120 [Paraburkholderia sp. EG287A]|uniref:hypothetical protein n=1 Tax=Paraburkholderia sp. EG287A TaxID=3237012 RepID=UPI0034D261DF
MHTQIITSVKLNPRAVNVDMRAVAAKLLGVGDDAVDLSGEPFYVTQDTQLWRFGLTQDAAGPCPDKMHLLVDGCGGTTVIHDPDTPHAVTSNVHLSDMIPM